MGGRKTGIGGRWRNWIAAELLYRHRLIRLLKGGGLFTSERVERLLLWPHSLASVHNRVRMETEDEPVVESLGYYFTQLPISVE
jgi:hypothetical protein